MSSPSAVSASNFSRLTGRLRTINLRPPQGINEPSDSDSDSSSFLSESDSDESNTQTQKNQSSDSFTPSFNRTNRFSLISRNSSEQSSSSVPEGQTSDRSAPELAADENSANETDQTQLSSAERRQVQKLKRIDSKVRAHEQAHLAAAGQYAQGGASFEYVTGPDGQQYAVSGQVSLDTSEASSPEETIDKMRQVRQAALAPANPSPQDFRIASQASQKLAEARSEANQENSPENGRQQSVGNATNPSNENSSEGISSGSESGPTSFERPGDFGVQVSQGTQSFIEGQETEIRSSSPLSNPENDSDSNLKQFTRFSPNSTPQRGQVLNLIA